MKTVAMTKLMGDQVTLRINEANIPAKELRHRIGFPIHFFDQICVALKSSRPIAFGLHIAKMTGNSKAAIFLSQLVHWTRSGKRINDTDGWVFKTYQQWWQETGLSRTELDTVRRRLHKMGLIEEIRAGRPATLWYRLNLSRFAQSLEVCRGKALGITLTFEFMQVEDRQVRDLLGPTTAFHSVLAKLTGSINAGLLLSRLLQLQRRALETRKEWITFTSEMWRDDLGMNRRALENARRRLVDLNLIDEVRIHQGTPRILTQIRPRQILDGLAELAGAADSGGRAALKGLRRATPPRLAATAIDVRYGRQDNRHKQHQAIIPASVGNLSTNKEIVFFKNQEVKNSNVQNLQTRNDQREFHDCSFRTYEFVGFVPSSLQVSYISCIRSTNTPTTTPPPPTRVERLEETPRAGQSCGVRDLKTLPPENPKASNPSSLLEWPSMLPASLQDGALMLLRPVANAAQAQKLLDELAGHMRSGTIRNPLGYLRRLVEQAVQGTFVAELAHLETHRRAVATHVQASLAGTSVVPGPASTAAASAGEEAHNRAVARAALATLRETMRGWSS